jgi:hypothetical protein
MPSPLKVVLVSTNGYSPNPHDALLQNLVARKIEVFCAVGVEADKWEDALDWLCVGEDGSGTHFILTSAHLGESEEEVIEFASGLQTSQPSEVEVVRV